MTCATRQVLSISRVTLASDLTSLYAAAAFLVETDVATHLGK
jgi:hypothetical protein